MFASTFIIKPNKSTILVHQASMALLRIRYIIFDPFQYRYPKQGLYGGCQNLGLVLAVIF